MKTYLTYGFGAAFIGFLVSAGLYFAGFHSTPEKLVATNWILPVVGLLGTTWMMVLGIREVRETVPMHREFGYGAGFKVAFLIALFAAVGSVITNYLYSQVLNPEFGEILLRSQEAKMRADGASEEAVNGAMAFMRKLQSPIVSAIFTFFASLVFGTLLAALVPIFTRRKATLPPEAGVAPLA